MAIVILLGGLGLVSAGFGVAVKTAAHARREWEDLDGAFAEARGDGVSPEAAAAPWSSFDLAVLRDDVAAVDRRDPFATLTRASSPVSWHDPSRHHGAEPKPIVWRAPVEAA
jgi:hypothetical protein